MRLHSEKTKVQIAKIEAMKKIKAAYIAAQKAGKVESYRVQKLDAEMKT